MAARGGYNRAGYSGKRGASKTCNLRNEAICNVEENASILFGENRLCRLQKNDKWLRFFRNGGRGEDANTPHPNPLPQGEEPVEMYAEDAVFFLCSSGEAAYNSLTT
jgi:hypothetical protein